MIKAAMVAIQTSKVTVAVDAQTTVVVKMTADVNLLATAAVTLATTVALAHALVYAWSVFAKMFAARSAFAQPTRADARVQLAFEFAKAFHDFAWCELPKQLVAAHAAATSRQNIIGNAIQACGSIRRLFFVC